MESQPISVEALERPVEENRPQPNPVAGAGTGPKFRYYHLHQWRQVKLRENTTLLLKLPEIVSLMTP